MKIKEAQSMFTKRLLQLVTNTFMVFLVAFTMLGVQAAQAQDTYTWYVNSTEGDNTNDGSQMANAGAGVGPFLTFATATAAATDDDTIVVLAGTYTEDLDLDGFGGTVQVQAAGANTIADFDGLYVDEAVSISGGDGAFKVDYVEISYATLTIDSGILIVDDDSQVYMESDDTPSIATIAGASPSYEGMFHLYYNVDSSGGTDTDITTGIELPADGDMGGGDLYVGDSDSYDDGTFTVDQVLITNYLDVEDDGDAVFQGAVTADDSIGGDGDIYLEGSGTYTFQSTVDVDDEFDAVGTIVLVVQGAATADNFEADGGTDSTFESTLDVGGVDLLASAVLDLQGAASVDGDDFDHGSDDAVTTTDLDLNGGDLNVTGGGTFTMASTLTIGDTEAGGTRVSNASGTTTIDNIVLEATDDVGDDGSGGDGDETFSIIIDNDDVFVLNGTITEASMTDADDGDEDIDYVVEIENADDALFTFNATTSFTGDVTNAATVFDNDGLGGDDEGMEVGTGATVSVSSAGAFSGLGFWGGLGTMDITEDGADLDNLSEVGNFVLSGVRDFTTVAFVATGNVDIQSDGVTIASAGGASDVGGVLTVSGDGLTWDVTAAGETLTTDGLSVTGTGFTFGDAADDVLTSGGTTDLGDGTVHGDLNVDNGDFSTDGGAIADDFDVDGGSATFGGASSVGGTVNVEEDVTIVAGATVTWTDLDVDLSDILGTLTVNGELDLTDTTAGDLADPIVATSLTLRGGLTIASPDGDMDASEVDIVINGDFTGGLLDGLDGVLVNIPSGGATFTPGPNTIMHGFSVTGSGRTLAIGLGFEIDELGLGVQNDATIALGSQTITISDGGLTLDDEAAVTTSEPAGALAFTGGGVQVVAVTGAPTTDPVLSNIRINGTTTLDIDDDIDISGDVSLNDGTWDIDATVNMTGAVATITRDPSTGLLDASGGTLDGAWDVVYFGSSGRASGEFADGHTDDVTVNMSDGESIVMDVAGTATGNLHVEDGLVDVTADVEFGGNFTNSADLDQFDVDVGGSLTIGGDFTVTESDDAPEADFASMDGDVTIGGDLSVPTDMVLDGRDLFLTGDSSSHTNAGSIQNDIYVNGITVSIAGTTDDVNADAGVFDSLDFTDATATMTDIQETGDIFLTDSSVDISYVDGDDEAITDNYQLDGASSLTVRGTTANADGIEADDVTIYDTSSITLEAGVEWRSLILADSDDDDVTMDLNGNTLSFYDCCFDALLDATVTVTDGTIEIQDDAGVRFDVTFNLEGLVLPNFTNNDATDVLDVLSDFEVSGTYTAADNVNVDLNGNTLTLSGDAVFGADVNHYEGEFETTGTTITSAGDTAYDDLTINSSSTTTFADDGDGPYEVTVGGDFTQTMGDMNITDQDFTLTGGVFDSDDGDINMDAGGQFYIGEDTDFDTNDRDMSFLNFGFDAVVDMTLGDGGDGITVTGELEIDDGGAVAMDDPTVDEDSATFTVGDGATIFVFEDGVLAIFEEDPTLGTGLNYDYDSGAPTTSGNELATDIATLTLRDDTDLNLDDDVSLTVSGSVTLDGTLDIDPDDGDEESVTLADGGTLTLDDDGAFNGEEGLTFAGDYHLVIDGEQTTNDEEFPAAPVPLSLTINDDLEPHEDRTVVDFITDAELDLTTSVVILTVTGDLTVEDDASWETDDTAYLSMAGSAAQTMTSDGAAPGDLEIDNAAGVTLDGSDLDFSGGGTLYLTDGPLTTGDNTVILDHGGTADQGYTRVDGVINGNVEKDADLDDGPPNRIEFPTGDATGNYRPFAITFNDPEGDIGLDPVTFSVAYDGTSPMGTNGLPIATTDSEGNDLSIGRYPEFHWVVSSDPTISPSVDYDVEYQADGYDNFEGESVERTRAIRRQDGATTNFWILTSPEAGDNDNFALSATEPKVVARNAVGAINSTGVLFTFGLEQNMVAHAVADVTLNAGNTEDIDLLAVFDGGDEDYSYDISGDDAVATGADAADVLTVTGVGAGVTTLTVVATDGFGDTATASVAVTVNAAFVAGDALDPVTVNEGAADQDVDASGASTGGTAPVGYAVGTDDAAVATATVDAAGLVTVTFVGVGTATVTVTATDDEGDTVDSDIAVTVNASVGANDALADVTLDAGETADTDVSGEFTGGTIAADYAYTAASDDEDVATVSVDGATVTATGVSAYTVVDGEVTGDAAAATVTVTATDDLGATFTSTYTVDVNPVSGDVDGSGGPSPAGASAILDYSLGLTTMTAKQQAAADYNGDSDVTAFDAALVFAAFFGGKGEIAATPTADLSFGEIVRENNIVFIPVIVTGDVNEVVSASFSTLIDPAFATIVGVTSELSDGWLFRHVVREDGSVLLALAGFGGMSADGSIATINIELTSSDVQFNLGAEGAVNDNPTMSIDDVEVAQLPETFSLHGNYPNPFNPSTAINFDLPESADVEIHVIDMIGRQVMTLPATTIAAGANRTIQIDASRLASGTYFYRVIAKMESKTLIETGRMMLVK